MENKQKFNKELFTTIVLPKFLKNYRNSKQEALRKQAELEKLRKQYQGSTPIDDIPIQITVEDAYRSLLSVNINQPEKIQILENCRNLFESDSAQKEVDLEIATIRSEINATKGREPTDSEIAKWFIKCFPEELFNTDKRTYDMSKIASKDTLSTSKTPQGVLKKDVDYVTFEQIQQQKLKKDGKKIKRPEAFLADNHGNPIHIKLIGCLVYGIYTYKKSLFKYSITKTIDGIEQEYKKFLAVDIYALKHDIALRKVVVSELLSKKNIERSNADDYIGEIFTESLLKTGTEKFQDSFYTYQITQKHALVYDGERIEAIRAYNQQQSLKNSNPKKTPEDER